MSISQDQPTRVLFVCLGNICRSPTAEAVFRQKAERAGWGALLQADSAGTAAYHLGKAPDVRSQQHGRVRGYDLSGLRARQVAPKDFVEFDHIIAMDADNLGNLQRIRQRVESECGQAPSASLSLLLDEHPDAAGQDVPDPYDGGAAAFEHVLDLVETATDGLLRRLLKARGVFGCGC